MPQITQAGNYDVFVKSAELTESNNGTPGLLLGLETQDESARHIYTTCWLSDKAFDGSIKSLRKAFNFDGNFDNLQQLVGKETTITVELETYEGKERARVKWLSQLSGPRALTNAASVAASLTARAKRIPTTEAPKAPAAPKAQRQAPPAATEGGCPF